MINSQETQNCSSKAYEFRIMITQICIKIKFPCSLHFEVLHNKQPIVFKKINIEPLIETYNYDQVIELLKQENKLTQWKKQAISSEAHEEKITISAKLTSNKGYSFTAGLIEIKKKQLQLSREIKSIKFTKSKDIEASCKYFVLEDAQKQVNLINKLSSIKEEQVENEEQRSTEALKGFYLLKSQISKHKVELEHEQLTHAKQVSKRNHADGALIYHTRVESLKSIIEENNQKYINLHHKLEVAEQERQNLRVNIEKLNQIIHMLERKNTQLECEKQKSKEFFRVLEEELDNKRSQIRTIDGEKISLSLQILSKDKQNHVLKEKINDILKKYQEKIQKICFDQEEKSIKRIQSHSRSKSSSIILNNSRRVNQKTQEFLDISKDEKLIRNSEIFEKPSKKVQQSKQIWFDDSQLFRLQLNGSQVIQNNQIGLQSIQKINRHEFQDISLNNSQYFMRQNSQILLKNNFFVNNSRDFIQNLIRNCQRSQDLIKQFSGKLHRAIRILKESEINYKKELQSSEQYLYNYIQQIEEILEKYEDEIFEKNIIIEEIESKLMNLDQHLLEANQKIHQNQIKIESLESENHQIREEMNGNRYEFSIQEEAYLKKIYQLEHGYSMPQMMSHRQFSPFQRKTKSRRKVVDDHFNRQAIELSFEKYAKEQEQLALLQSLREKEVELIIEKEEREKMEIILFQKNQEIIKLEKLVVKVDFQNKFKEKMNVLNESIEYESENENEKNEEKYTQESLGMEEEFMRVLK